MDPVVGGALLKLGADAFLVAVRAAWNYRHAAGGAEKRQEAELQEAYEFALRLMASLLFETRANLERVRYIVDHAKQGISFGVFDFSVSDALMPDFCRVVTTPQILEECRSILAAIKRIDFFQRMAPINQNLYGPGIGFAKDCLEKGSVERFNGLVEYANRVAAMVFPEWNSVGGGFLPDRIDLAAPIDHGLI